MVDKGANVNSIDSYVNSVLMRACADIQNRWTTKDRPLARETVEDLRPIFDLLISSGADIYRSTTTRKSVVEMNKKLSEQLKIDM